MESFKTIKEKIETQIVEKKSKFIAHLFHIETKEQAEEIIKKIKRQYYDARHNCYTYRITQGEKVIEKSSDDGEPSGTAGAPMLNILSKNNISNVLVIVTRYFGGILLGTGGLVKAYSDVLLKAIEKAEIVELAPGVEINVTIPYAEVEKFRYFCKVEKIRIIKEIFTDNVELSIEILEKNERNIIKKITDGKLDCISVKVVKYKNIMTK